MWAEYSLTSFVLANSRISPATHYTTETFHLLSQKIRTKTALMHRPRSWGLWGLDPLKYVGGVRLYVLSFDPLKCHILSFKTVVASGCVVECRICNREVAGSNLSLGYSAPRSAQPSIPPGSVNEYQLRLGRQRQVWFIPIADEPVDVQVKQ